MSKDGGPVFPVSTSDQGGVLGHQDGPHTWQFPGMSLRDYFAAHAPITRGGMNLVDHCACRYRYADAMLNAREK